MNKLIAGLIAIMVGAVLIFTVIVPIMNNATIGAEVLNETVTNLTGGYTINETIAMVNLSSNDLTYTIATSINSIGNSTIVIGAGNYTLLSNASGSSVFMNYTTHDNFTVTNETISQWANTTSEALQHANVYEIVQVANSTDNFGLGNFTLITNSTGSFADLEYRDGNDGTWNDTADYNITYEYYNLSAFFEGNYWVSYNYEPEYVNFTLAQTPLNTNYFSCRNTSGTDLTSAITILDSTTSLFQYINTTGLQEKTFDCSYRYLGGGYIDNSVGRGMAQYIVPLILILLIIGLTAFII